MTTVAAERRNGAEDPEELPRDHLAEEPFGITGAVGNRKAPAAEPGAGGNRRRHPADVLEIGVRETGAVETLHAIGRVDDDQPVGVGIWIGIEDDAVHDAENRRIDADAERQADDRDGRKTAVFGQRAQGVADILKQHAELDGNHRARVLKPDWQLDAPTVFQTGVSKQ
jgi:hypothetical protein